MRFKTGTRVLGIGGTELVIILLFGFLIFGPDKLPQMGRTIGRGIRQFRHAQEEMNKVVRQEVYDPSGDDEPLSDSISGIFKEFTGEGKKDKKKAEDHSEKRADEADTTTQESKAAEEDAVSSKETKTVETKEVKGESFAQKKARLAREKAEREKAKQAKSEKAEDGEDK